MFQTLRLRGLRGASISWGYQPAATVTTWTVTRRRDDATGQIQWTLQATLGATVDTFRLRQRPLLFTAPRRGGFWTWPLRELQLGSTTVTANLDPPEQ